MVDVFQQAAEQIKKEDPFIQAAEQMKANDPFVQAKEETDAVNGDVFEKALWEMKQTERGKKLELSEDGFFEGYYNFLHEKPENAKGVLDWLGRVLPTSISRTTVGALEFPYHAIKSFTDPLIGLAEDIAKASNEKEFVEKRVAQIGKAAWDIVDGISRFFGEPLGLYGWEKLKDKWLGDPAAAILGVAPTLKGVRTQVVDTALSPTEFGKHSKNIIKRNLQQAYDKLDVQAPFIRTMAEKTGVAVKNMPSIKISEQNRALQVANGIKDLKLDENAGVEVTLQASNSRYKNQNPSSKIKMATKRVIKYYNESFKRLKEDGVLTHPWPKSHILRNEKMIEDLSGQIKVILKRIDKELDFAKTKTETKRTQSTKTLKGKDIAETVETIEGIEQSKSSKVWEERTKDALKARGFSEGEANIAIEKLRETGGDKTRVITKTVGGNKVKTVKIEKTVKQVIKKTSPLMKRINGLKSKVNDLKTEMSELEGVNHQLKTLDPQYVHIPIQSWFSKIRETLGENTGQKAINSFFGGRFFKTRKTIDIGDMIERMKEMKDQEGNPIFEPSDFDARMIMASYAQKVGSMRGLAKVFNNAKREGLVIPKKGETAPNGYGDVPLETQIRFPELKNHYVHNAFNEYLSGHLSKFDRGMELGRIFGYTKMLQFYNFLFLPAYDLWQASWAGSLKPWNVSTADYFANGFRSMLKKDKDYYNALESGTMSTPYTPPFIDFKKDIQSTIYMPMAERALKGLGARIKNPFKVLDDFMKLNWNLAWSGDAGIRMGTYKYFKDKGFSNLDAGQMTAYFHGDYARMAPGARKVFNKIFFTPTFKYTMGHLQANMIKSSIRVMDDAIKLKSPARRDMLLAKGFLMLVAGQTAKDYLMKSWGFKTNNVGLRYVKEVETDEGTKELVLYSPDPGNVLLRQFYKWTTWGDDPEKTDEFLNKLHWDLHPLWTLGYELIKNDTGRSGEDRYVYNLFDSDGTLRGSGKVAWDIIHHSISKIIAAEGAVEQYVGTKDSQSAYKALRKEIGWLNEKFLSATTLAYLRNPEDMRKAQRVRGMQRLFNELAREDTPKTDKESERRIGNFFKRLEDIMDEEKE